MLVGKKPTGTLVHDALNPGVNSTTSPRCRGASVGCGLLFGNDGGGNFVAYDASTGKPLWHAGLGTNTSNGPQTFLLDGRQYIVVGAGDSLYAFALGS